MMLRFPPSEFFDSALGFLDSLPFSPVYDLLIPFSIILLSFRVWKIQSKLRSGCCSKCEVSGEFSPKTLSSDKLSGGYSKCCNGDDGVKEEGFCSRSARCGLSGSEIESREGEAVGGGGEDDAMKSRKELVKERVLGVVDTEASKVQSCWGILCENCGRTVSLQKQNHIGSKDDILQNHIGSKDDADNDKDDAVKSKEELEKDWRLQASVDLGTRSCFNCACYGVCDPKVQSCIGFLWAKRRGKMEDEKDDEGEESFDEEDDINEFRKELAKERRLRALVELELEKERRAASSAADETMAKISSLQNEKGLIEREFRQYREIAEQKQAYDREVINNLKRIILKLEQESIGSETLISEAYDC